MAAGRRDATVLAQLYNDRTLAYRDDDGFAILAQWRIAQGLALGL